MVIGCKYRDLIFNSSFLIELNSLPPPGYSLYKQRESQKGFNQIMLFSRSQRLPGGVKHQRRNNMQGMPTIPKIINVPIL